MGALRHKVFSDNENEGITSTRLGIYVLENNVMPFIRVCNSDRQASNNLLADVVIKTQSSAIVLLSLLKHFLSITMQYLTGEKFVKSDQSEVSSRVALNDIEMVGFYFGANWSPPCQLFTPMLSALYKSIKAKNMPIEIIYVSSDESQDSMLEDMKKNECDWLALKHSSTTSKMLKDEFTIKEIPALVIVRKSGEVVTRHGYDDVETYGNDAVLHWS